MTPAAGAGLLTQIGAAPDSVSKHAAVALAEWLAITHRDQGIRVSCLCPMTVNTPMVPDDQPPDGPPLPVLSEVLEPEHVAVGAVEGITDERLLILPQPDVREHMRRRADHHDRWLLGMRRLQARALGPGSRHHLSWTTRPYSLPVAA
jgi:NAD(P)-dependent dehydrogenase (short-subunit alcohol dehydrogenase family)